MTRWGRWGGILAGVGLVAALSGCGQLFTESHQPATLAQLSSRVDSLDAQVGQLQAAVSGGGSAAASTVPAGLASAMVEADVLNVRDDPSLTGTIRGTLLQNAVVGILTEDGNWTQITYTNPRTGITLTGWVDADYLGPANPAAGGAAAPGAAASNSSTAAGGGTASATGTASGTGTASTSGTAAAAAAAPGLPTSMTGAY